MHCLDRAKQRYNLELTEFDLIFIILLCKQGLAKEMAKPRNMYGVKTQGDLYHLRYAGKLIAPVILNDIIVTFMNTGKRNSFKKWVQEKISDDFKYKQKRLKRKDKR